jgi:hypothetical protein
MELLVLMIVVGFFGWILIVPIAPLIILCKKERYASEVVSMAKKNVYLSVILISVILAQRLDISLASSNLNIGIMGISLGILLHLAFFTRQLNSTLEIFSIIYAVLSVPFFIFAILTTSVLQTVEIGDSMYCQHTLSGMDKHLYIFKRYGFFEIKIADKPWLNFFQEDNEFSRLKERCYNKK